MAGIAPTEEGLLGRQEERRRMENGSHPEPL